MYDIYAVFTSSAAMQSVFTLFSHCFHTVFALFPLDFHSIFTRFSIRLYSVFTAVCLLRFSLRFSLHSNSTPLPLRFPLRFTLEFSTLALSDSPPFPACFHPGSTPIPARSNSNSRPLLLRFHSAVLTLQIRSDPFLASLLFFPSILTPIPLRFFHFQFNFTSTLLA